MDHLIGLLISKRKIPYSRMPKKEKYSTTDIIFIVFLILGALGLTKAAEWWLRNAMTKIEDIVSVLEWLAQINSMETIPMLLSYMFLISGMYISGYVLNKIIEKIRSFFNEYL